MTSYIFHPVISQMETKCLDSVMEISEIRRTRLQQVINEHFKGVQAAFCEKADIDSSYVSRIFTAIPEHRRNIGEKMARKIEEKLRLEPGYMDVLPAPATYQTSKNQTSLGVAYERPNYHTPNVSPVTVTDLEKRSDVPLLTWVSAGVWLQNHGSFGREDAERWMPCPIPHGDMTFALRVEGDSMTSPYPNEKSYPHGTLIYVDPEKQLYNGCRVVAWLAEQSAYTFKRYVEDAGRKYLKPLNPTYDTIPLSEGIEICGVVIGSFFEE